MSPTYVALAASADDLTVFAPALRALMIEGGTVHLVLHEGTIGPELKALTSRYRIKAQPGDSTAATPRGPIRRLRAALERSAPEPQLDELGQMARDDARLAALVRAADVLLPIGDAVVDASRALQQVHPQIRVMTPPQLEVTYHRIALGWALAKVGQDPRRGLSSELTTQILDQLRQLPSIDAAHLPGLVDVVAGLHAQGNHETAWQAVGMLRERSLGAGSAPTAGWDAAQSAEFEALAVQVELSATGTTSRDLPAVVTAVLAGADESLAAWDLDAAARRLTRAMGVLFHRELHADTLRSPLVEDPDAFLAPLRASAVHEVLLRPVARRRRQFDRRTRVGSVLVLPGSYGRFSRAVLGALGDRIEARVLELGGRSPFFGMGPHEGTVRARLGQALGAEITPDYELLEGLEGCDVTFTDWADRGAVWTAMHLPQDVRMVLRIHSMDALSPWIHVLDWSRVSDVVFVSEHLRDIVLAQVADQLRSTRVHVIANLVDLGRFADGARQAEPHRTLGLVGWAQTVKDPIWAIEVLARLRAEDHRWRLRLIGTDFQVGSTRSSQDYARAFYHRLVQDDVVGAVDFVDFTEDLPRELGSVDIILSSSRRESFGVGLVEGVAAGAVPVVRNWPMFARHDAARTLFPPEWVVDDVDQAVQRIRAVTQPQEWAQASRSARERVAVDFDPVQVASRYLEVLAGSDAMRAST